MSAIVVYEESAPENGAGERFSLALAPSAQAVRRFELDGRWRVLAATFAPFPLVEAFVSMLLTERPRRVVVDSLSGASMDLARLAFALGFDVAVRLPAKARWQAADEDAWRWLGGLLRAVRWLLPAPAREDEALLRQRLAGLPACVEHLPEDTGPDAPLASGFGYEAYALGRRDHGLLLAMQQGLDAHFAGCSKVLDVGCGTGVFLEVLARKRVPAVGVERNAVSARFAESLGHEVIVQDALDFLRTSPARWDGVYCSHFIEHLPIDAAECLVRDVAAALVPGGVAVFVFPDPESIRSQLLGFWRDPEHVRFYHPELVAALAQVHGLELEYDSQRQPGRRVVPFAMEPPLPAAVDERAGGPWDRLLRRLGIAPAAALAAERARADALEAAVRQLWAVNQTWAWDDNAVLRLRKRGGETA